MLFVSITVCPAIVERLVDEFWDFLGGDGVYWDLLGRFEKVGIELRTETDQHFEKFRN